MAIKLTKNEQKLQKDRLKQYQRYLPTLQLKKQQLQAVITKTKADLEQKEVERAQMIGDLDDWVAVFAENEIFAESKKLDHLVQPDTVICKNENIAGVTVPAFQELTFKDIAYDVDDYPLWVDTAIIKLREIARHTERADVILLSHDNEPPLIRLLTVLLTFFLFFLITILV